MAKQVKANSQEVAAEQAAASEGAEKREAVVIDEVAADPKPDAQDASIVSADASAEPSKEEDAHDGHTAKEDVVAVDPDAADKIASGAAKDPGRLRVALGHLEELHRFLKHKKEDEVINDLKLHKVHYHAILEMGDLKAARKLTHLSDGSCELLSSVYKRLKPRMPRN
jgi:hypothetical protein